MPFVPDTVEDQPKKGRFVPAGKFIPAGQPQATVAPSAVLAVPIPSTPQVSGVAPQTAPEPPQPNAIAEAAWAAQVAAGKQFMDTSVFPKVPGDSPGAQIVNEVTGGLTPRILPFMVAAGFMGSAPMVGRALAAGFTAMGLASGYQNWKAGKPWAAMADVAGAGLSGVHAANPELLPNLFKRVDKMTPEQRQAAFDEIEKVVQAHKAEQVGLPETAKALTETPEEPAKPPTLTPALMVEGKSKGPGAASTKDIPPPKQVSIRNGKVDEERTARGELPLMAPARKAMGTIWDEAMNRIESDPGHHNRDHGPALVDDILSGKKKEISETDHAALLHEKIDVMNERDAAAERAGDQNASEEDRQEAHIKWAALEDRINDIDHATQQAGTISGRALQFRQALANDDFTFAGMERRARAAKGGPITKEESDTIKAQAARIEELQKQLEAAQGAAKDKGATAAADATVKNLNTEATVKNLNTEATVKNLNTEAGKSKVQPGDILAQGEKITAAIKKAKEAGDTPKDLQGMIQKLALNFVRRGIKEREPLIDAVHNVLSKIFPDMERTDTRDAISGYGDYKQLDPEPAKAQLRQLKGEMQQIGKIEDMQAGQAPKKTGVERRVPSDQERALIKEVNELKKKGGFDVTDPATQLKSALDAVKTRLRNRQRDLETALATGEKIPGKNGGVPYDEETNALKAQVADLQKEYDKINPKEPMSEEERQRVSLKAYKTRTATRIADLQDRIARGKLEPPARKPPIQLDPEAEKLKAQAERVKDEFRQALMNQRLANRTPIEKALDTFVKWRRGFILSGPVTLAKLTSAAIQRMTITPIEEGIGAGLAKIPGLSEVAAKAPREGGLNIRAEAKAITEGFTKGMADAWQVLKTGKSDLDAVYGKKNFMPREGIDFIGSIHAALKSVTKRNEFARSFEKLTARAMAGGVDVTDPMVQSRIALEAYKEANRSIFMQDNRVVSAYKRLLSAFDQPDKSTGKVPLGSKIIGTTARVLLPIVKVPTNIVAETMQYAVGLITGSARFAKAVAGGLENLNPEEAELIMRNLKKGSIGGALLISGYLNSDKIGGYYQPGKRDSKDVKFGSVRIGNIDIPSYLIHNPALETLQIGATIRRVQDSYLRKRDTEKQGIGAGITAGALGLTGEVPFVREMGEVTKAFNPQERGAFFGEMGKSLLVPEAVQWAAQYQDKNTQGDVTKRQPDTIMQHIETGIPWLREEVPKKKEPAGKPMRGSRRGKKGYSNQ